MNRNEHGIAPCRDCTKRALGCHSGCESYREWQEYRLEEKRERLKRTRGEREYSRLRRETFETARRRYGFHKGLRD